MKRYADVVVGLPVEGVFTYEVPPHLEGDVAVGKRVLVPFSRRTVTGYVVALKNESHVERVRAVADVIDEVPVFDAKRLRFLNWLASYYLAPPGEVFQLIHPPSTTIKSYRYFRLTDEGRSLLDGPSGKDRTAVEVCRALCDGGKTLSALTRRFRSGAVCSVLERLKRDGLVEEEVLLRGGGRSRVEKLAYIPAGLCFDQVPEEIRTYAMQKRLFEYLRKNGPTPLRVLRKEFGHIDGSLGRLGQRGLVCIEESEVSRDPFREIPARRSDHAPNREQAEAIRTILSRLGDGYSPYLLYGVTGSGKTLVYLRVIEEVVRSGGKAVYLVPEIALTASMAGYLAGRFPGRVAVQHSGLSDGERYDQWRRILRGEVDVVVGARSALFSPLKDLGVIIVDEEHDPSYKQEEGVRYNARDAALMLGKILGITVILGSATPSMETFYNSRNGRVTAIRLEERVEGAALPDVEVLDVRGKSGTIISERLASLMEETLERGEQALLFLNRRGFSNFLICRDCGHAVRCLNCSVTLTFHKAERLLRCHYCDLSMEPPERCPRCDGYDLADPGLGTEKVEEEVMRLFPRARTARLDRDTTRRKGSTRRILEMVEARSVDVLIGTQMVSKGHHFPGITLVGIISADTSLNVPDFRGAERTFQLIAQTSGRAGRGGAPSRVVIQTLNPQAHCFRAALCHDYEVFFEEEMKLREEAGYPPLVRLALVRIEGLKEEAVVKTAGEVKKVAQALLRGSGGGASVLGPVPSAIPRLRGRHRWQMLVKGRSARGLNAFLRSLRGSFEKMPAGLSLIIDVDPSGTL